MDKREVMLEHYTNPFHFQKVSDDNFNAYSANHTSCVDHITIYVKVENDVIIDIYFDGEACAICTSSASILVKNIYGRTLKEATQFVSEVENMIEQKEFELEIVNEAIVYEDIYKQNNRKICALLPYVAIKKLLF